MCVDSEGAQDDVDMEGNARNDAHYEDALGAEVQETPFRKIFWPTKGRCGSDTSDNLETIRGRPERGPRIPRGGGGGVEAEGLKRGSLSM